MGAALVSPHSGDGSRGPELRHLGATAGPIIGADKVLLGRPDVLIIGVGGGNKIYDGAEMPRW